MVDDHKEQKVGIGVRPGLTNRVLRALVFWIGDVRRIKHFPWVTWDVHQHEIDLNEAIQEALPLLEPGDIVLHRDTGYLSNAFIGGCMVHAGLYVGDGQVVEAISEGVVKRHAAHILHSDYACVLRPRLAGKEVIIRALALADKIVGMPYDHLFNFNYVEELNKIEEFGAGEAARRGVKFCCTEISSFCYLERLAELRFFRRRNIGFVTRLLSWFGLNPGEAVIDADQYVTAETDIVWLSRKFTAAWAEKMECSEEYVYKVAMWWNEAGDCH